MCKNEIQETIGAGTQYGKTNESDMINIKAKSMLNNGLKRSKIEGDNNKAERSKSKTPNR